MAGFLKPRSLLLGLLLSVVVGAVASVGRPARSASADCAFPFIPITYETLKDRRIYLDAIELAAFNMLFPGDAYFGLPDLAVGPRASRTVEPPKVPPTLLKGVDWIESGITQAAVNVPFGSIGPALVSFDCGHGIAQVTSGMTAPLGENGRGSPEQALIASHFAYNIARGAFILADKWNQAPLNRPIAGTDFYGTPAIVEDWYFAVWSYNGFTGPGANRSNHPMDPIYGTWPRAGYSCGPTGDGKGHNRGNYPYQELVFGCVGSPPLVDNRPLWLPLPISLPDLNNPVYRTPLSLANFIFPYTNMDIPAPQPVHLDASPPPDPARRSAILGAPVLSLNKTATRIGVSSEGGSTVETVEIRNAGTGLLPWYATASVPWLTIKPYAGAAVGPELTCTPNSPCNRVSTLEISVDTTKAPPGRRVVSIEIRALGTTQSTTINVEVVQVIRLGAPGVIRE